MGIRVLVKTTNDKKELETIIGLTLSTQSEIFLRRE